MTGTRLAVDNFCFFFRYLLADLCNLDCSDSQGLVLWSHLFQHIGMQPESNLEVTIN